MCDYREYAPSPALAPYVECFWSARRDAQKPAPMSRGTGGGDAHREILLPDGTTQLLLSFGGTYRRFAGFGARDGEHIVGSHLVGLRATGVFIEQEGGEDVFAVRFRAGGLARFLALPASALVQRSIPLDMVLGAAGIELEARVAEAPTDEARVRAADALLVRQLRALHVTRRAQRLELQERQIQHAVRRIYATQGRIAIDALRADLGMSYRAIDRAFAAHVGVPPKRLGRIVRFNHALLLLRRRAKAKASTVSHSTASHSWVAQEAGYADQAHLIRDFRAFTQSAPVEFLARRYGIVEVSHPALERRLSNSFNPSH